MTDRRNDNGRRNEDERLARIETKLDDIIRRLDKKVNRDEFAPVKAIAYGMVALLMSAMVWVIVANVF